jgi:hypothetical protein
VMFNTLSASASADAPTCGCDARRYSRTEYTRFL